MQYIFRASTVAFNNISCSRWIIQFKGRCRADAVIIAGQKPMQYGHVYAQANTHMHEPMCSTLRTKRYGHNASKHTREPMCIPVAGHMGLSAALFSSHMQPAHALTCFQLLVLGEEPNILTTACAPPTPNRLARVGTYSLTHSRCIHPRRPTPYVQLVHPF